MVISGMMAYVELPAQLVKGLGTWWISFPVKGTGAAQGNGSQATGDALSSSDLSQLFAGLTSAGDTVTDDGTVQLNGAPTHEYSISASQSTAQSQFSSLFSQVPSSMSGVLRSISLGAYDVNLYVNANGTVAEVDVSSAVTQGHDTQNLALKLSLFNYGQPVSVRVPPPMR